mmetsp:Transcript_15051/g.44651  ORF Transcript_15051/g.44651 Transcript_15051/m.44651 type:complete len:93 (+) Transcript_15051:98-376(+)
MMSSSVITPMQPDLPLGNSPWLAIACLASSGWRETKAMCACVALLFRRLEDEYRPAREGREGADDFARCALLEGVEEREERVLRPNLLRAVG